MRIVSERGFSYIEILVGLGILSIVSFGLLKISDMSGKSDKSFKSSLALNQNMVMLSESLERYEICELNFKGLKFKANTQLQEIIGVDNRKVAKVGDLVTPQGVRVLSISLGSYDPMTKRGEVVIQYQNPESVTGPRVFNKKYYIVVDVDNDVITNCVDDAEVISNEYAKNFCKQIDPAGSGDCEYNYEKLLEDVKSLYCGKDHPFLAYDGQNKKCMPLDANKRCPTNGLFKGYDENGQILCYFPPASAPNLPECKQWGSWSPESTSLCTGVTITQERSCLDGATGKQSRTVEGTKQGSECCTRWAGAEPPVKAEDICEGETVSQTISCEAGWSGSITNVITGTKSNCLKGACNVKHPVGWSTKTCSCAEFYWPHKVPSSISALANGDEATFSGNHCMSGSSSGGHGTAKFKCENGTLIQMSATCKGGHAL